MMIEIGNLRGVPEEDRIYIYEGDTLEIKACLAFPDALKYHQELMSDHYVEFPFNYDEMLYFKRTDYIKYGGLQFTLRLDHQPTEANIHSYQYKPKFEAPEMLWLDFICFYRYQGLEEIGWTMTEKAEKFFQIGIDNINLYTGEEWKLGIIEPDEQIEKEFDGITVFDMFTEVAEDLNAEWYLDYQNKTVNLVFHYEHGEVVTLQREVHLTDIKKSNANNDDYCTRLYAFGSTKNIPSDYRETNPGEAVEAVVQKRLRLPESNGDYIDAFRDLKGNQIIQKVKKFEHIYPKRVATITSIREVVTKNDEGAEMTVFYIKDSALQFKDEYILPGKTLMLIFGENSYLSGRNFELEYHAKSEEFEIFNNQDNPDMIIPNDIMKPRVGDFYVLYNFNIALVGDQYVPEAEQELLEEAEKWMDSIKEDNATYTCPVNPVHRMKYDLDLLLGQRVCLKSLIFKDGEKNSRIYGFDKYPATGKDEYLVGDKPKYSRYRKIEDTVEENKRLTDVQILEAMKAAKGAYRTAKALNYLRTALQNETTIEGGLILTTLIQMGQMLGDVWVNTSGMSGIRESDDDIAFWAGGTLEQAINLVNNPAATEDVANYVVTHGGKSFMNKAVMRGLFESNSDGNRITIDPTDRSLKFVNEIGQTLIQMHFEKTVYPVGTFYFPKILINHYGWNTGSDPIYVLEISGYEVRLYDKTNGYSSYLTPEAIGFLNIEDENAPSFGVSKGYDTNRNVVLTADFKGLPSSKGDVYIKGLYTTSINGHTVICKK